MFKSVRRVMSNASIFSKREINPDYSLFSLQGAQVKLFNNIVGTHDRSTGTHLAMC